MNKYPDLIVINGEGTFSSGTLNINASFEITNYPEKTIIEVTTQNESHLLIAVFSNNIWKLEGKTDKNITVYAEDLQITNVSDKVIFEPLKELRYGDFAPKELTEAKFPLIGLYSGSIDLNVHRGSIISEELVSKTLEIHLLGERWNLQLEGEILKIKQIQTTIDEYQVEANNICLLLSLAVGNSVIFNRQFYYKDDQMVLEIWRRKAGYHYGVEPCIPDFLLNRYLECTLNSFEKWGKKKKDLFFSTVNYINSANQGFLEDRLLRLCIAWESLALKLVKTYTLPKLEIELLKEFLEKSIDNFDLPECLDRGFIKDRIAKALEWEKLYNSIVNLVNHYNLDCEKLHLDIKKLIKIRNDVAHSGQFRKKYPKTDLADLVFYSKTGLQAILLLELGYTDLILFQDDKSVTKIKIDEFKKTIT
jgi:hypothetical protein